MLPGADEAVEGLKRNWKGGAAATVLSGASREGAKKLAQGDVAGAAGEFATNYAIGAVGESALKKAAATGIGKRVVSGVAKRIPAAVSRFAGGTVASGGLAAPALAAWAVADVADGLTEGFTGKGIVTHGREAGERAEQRKADLTAAGVSKTDQRRMFRRSTGSSKPRPQPGANAGQWWNKALGALGLSNKSKSRLVGGYRKRVHLRIYVGVGRDHSSSTVQSSRVKHLALSAKCMQRRSTAAS